MKLETVHINVHHFIKGSNVNSAGLHRHTIPQLHDRHRHHTAVQGKGISGANVSRKFYLRSRLYAPCAAMEMFESIKAEVLGFLKDLDHNC